MASPQILIKAKPNTDGAICAWMDAVAEKYPSYTSMFIKMALKRYITTGEYLHLGSVPPLTEGYPFKRKEYVISIFVDEEIDNWRADIKSKKMVIKLAILTILSNCITIKEGIEKPQVSSYGDLVEIPSMKSKTSSITTTTYVRQYNDVPETIPPKRTYAPEQIIPAVKVSDAEPTVQKADKKGTGSKSVASKTGRSFW